MLRYQLQILGYGGMAALGLGVPGYLIYTGPQRLLWAGVLLFALAVTLLLLWLYRSWFDPTGCSIRRGSPGGHRVAFTFDDGPNGGDTEAILDVLKRHGARATFFCVGRQAAVQPDILRRMAKEGHVIGNHTHEHRRLPWLSRDQIAQQIDDAQQAIGLAGVVPPRWFRAPHGFKSLLLPGLLRERNMRLCAWTYDLRDFDRPGAEVLVQRARRRLRDGDIVLLHDGGGERSQTAAALDEMLHECRRRGLSAVTVAEIVSSP